MADADNFENTRDLAEASASPEDPPVTAVASRRVLPGREEEFERWASGILGAANAFPGYLGSEVLRPSGPEDDEYQIVFRFDHASNLKRWEHSEERRRWLRGVQPLLREEGSISSPASRPGSRCPPSRGSPRRATRWPS